MATQNIYSSIASSFSNRCTFQTKTILLLASLMLGGSFSPALAAEVSNSGDSGAGSLRQLLPAAVDNEEITFSVGSVSLSSGNTIMVNSSNVTINGLQDDGTRERVIWTGNSSAAPAITQGAAESGLALEHITFSQFSRVGGSQVFGGGLISAQTNNASSALMGNLEDVSFIGNTVNIPTLFTGAGLVGAGSLEGTVTIGNVLGEYTSNIVNIGTLNGAGLVGAGVTDSTGGYASIGSIDGIFTDNQVRTGSDLYGGGLIGASVWTGNGSAFSGSLGGLFSGNQVTVDNGELRGGGLVGTQTYQGFSWTGGVYPSASFTSNSVTSQALQGGGLVGAYSWNTAVMDTVGGTYTNNTVNVGSQLHGGGLTGAFSYGNAQTNSASVVMTGNTIRSGLLLMGGGLVGSASEDGEAMLGDVTGVFGEPGNGNIVVSGGDLYGGGILGATAYASGSSSVGWIGANIGGNVVTVANNLLGGGLVGSYSNTGPSFLGIHEGHMIGNTVTIGGDVVGGGLSGVYSITGNPSLGMYSGTTANNTVSIGGSVTGGGLFGAWGGPNSSANVGGFLEALVTGNTVSFSSLSATPKTITGGLMGFSGLAQQLHFVDSQITGNQVSVTGSNYTTDGGLVYIDTNYLTGQPGGHQAVLSASDGKVMDISGNSFLVNGVDQTKSFVFTQPEGEVSLADAALLVYPVGSGQVILAHPLYVNMNNDKEFFMAVYGPGKFFWDGRNELVAEGGAHTIFFEGSNSTLGQNFTITSSPAGQMSVTIEKGSFLTLDGVRNGNMALFDFTQAANAGTPGSFTVGDAAGGEGATISVDVSRLIGSYDNYYLVADGIDNGDRDDVVFIAGDNVVGLDATRNNQYWIRAQYASPHQVMVDCWKNLKAAVPTLEALIADRSLVSDEEVAALLRNLNSATPDHIANQAQAGIDTAGLVASSAVTHALPQGRAPWYNVHGEGSQSRYTLRPWIAYIGQFTRQGSHDCYRGYNQDVNGFLVGLNADLERFSMGLYVGYTDGSVETRGADSKVDSDGYHIGVVAKTAPFPSWDAFAVSLDAGYSHIENDSHRDAGVGDIEAEFDQNIYTAGLTVEHVFSLGDTSITPMIKARYTYLDQDSAKEKHGLTSAEVDSLDGYSFTTDVGASIAHSFSLSDDVELKPYANAFWRHEYGDRNFSSSAHYIRPNGGHLPDYTLKSVEKDRDSVVLGGGLQFGKTLATGQKIEVNLSYDANIGNHREDHSVFGGITYSF